MLSEEFKTEWTVLGVLIRKKAEARLAENKNNTRRDSEVYERLRDVEGLKSDNKWLDAVAKERDAYKQCVALVIAEVFG